MPRSVNWMKVGINKNQVYLGFVLVILLLMVGPVMGSGEILFEGPLSLSDNTVEISSYVSDESYEIPANTPLGALATVVDLPLKITDKSFEKNGILMLDAIGSFEYDKAQGKTWVCVVNGATLDDYGSPETDGLNIKVLSPGDEVSFFYGEKPVSADNAEASVLFSDENSGLVQDLPDNQDQGLVSAGDQIEEGNSLQIDADEWSISLTGAISDEINQTFFEESASCHKGSFTDEDGNEYTGIPLWRLLGWVDDEVSHGSEGFNDAAFESGYVVVVKAGDGYSREFSTKDLTTSDEIIIANNMNGEPLAADGEKPSYPLKLVGPTITGGNSVGNIVEIELIGLPVFSEKSGSDSTEQSEQKEIPQIHIVKYETDGKTIINETTVDYQWMEDNLEVIGDGKTTYKYEGITNNPEDLWNSNQSFSNGFKIESAVKGTLLRDLVNLVGGMEPGTLVKLVASDGYETKLGYPSVYPNPAALDLAGDPFLAFAKGDKVVPDFKEGYQLFFTGGDDQVFSNWDMHETMDSNHWHYYWESGVQYPSAGGLAAKYIETIEVYSEPESEWGLILDGTQIGGVKTDISSGYFDSALVCQFGSNHVATYTDSDGKTWKGMPLWFLCGFVDDADQHSNNAYNESLADSGYQIVITGTDGTSITLESADVKRSGDYILASIRDDILIPKDDASWPLVLTGSGVSDPVMAVEKIELKSLQ